MYNYNVYNCINLNILVFIFLVFVFFIIVLFIGIYKRCMWIVVYLDIKWVDWGIFDFKSVFYEWSCKM